MLNALYSPLTSVEPIDTSSCGPPFGALSRKRGSARCELKRPSFGCLTFFKWTTDVLDIVSIAFADGEPLGIGKTKEHYDSG